MAGTALAATQSVPAGGTVQLDGGLSNQPPVCDAGQTRVAHFILTGVDNSAGNNDQATLVGTIVTATFTNGTAQGAFATQGADDAVLVNVPLNSNTATVTGASFVVPNTIAGTGANAGLQYNNFNLSGGLCLDAPPPPPPSNTPELSSVALFGSGALGLVGFAAMRLRRRRQA
jgi:hypothetical protein